MSIILLLYDTHKLYYETDINEHKISFDLITSFKMKDIFDLITQKKLKFENFKS